jgi:two-component system phosphate regulon response regulator PhoB
MLAMKASSSSVMPGLTSKIVVVEDEPDVAEVIGQTLRREGFRVGIANNGQEALEEFRKESAALVLLDLMLPDMGGLDVLKALKRSKQGDDTRVIILTARTDEVDRILGFELGADDYVTKPFSPRELVLRVKAVLGRVAPETPEPSADTLRVGPIEIDMGLHEVRVGGRAVFLTLIEFRLLSELVRGSGRVRSRESLLSKVWGYDAEVMSRTVDTHVRRLRSKLGQAAPWLATVRGVGYQIRDPHTDVSG